ncbi:3-hydroxyacyl-CoA dehydrogenase NAD-binding domain-containing protein [Niveispirillum sp.]|uniref:3-hydroxyacyl-CoA dehydrogenase NAD-binding domain-containing protein n=1 Tax=Niveispirillum sp. TaxID=1917217 RepID=UPI001B650E70|nr:3-hydroxyacyl-CoA dehydrogenase NAD-binding domain-containing protein [Niveispirillum sp.]MBP7335654.1 3-hydroxyacyl-CoA dehydrogenase [Niveispirillum sp.]
MDQIRKVGVVGAGLIGGGWVAAFLGRGYDVSVQDPSADAEARLRAQVEAAWPALESLGLSPGASPDRLTFHADLAIALDGVDFVQENAPERPDVKAELYARLGDLLPADVIIASSTSGLPISLLQRDCRHPQRCVLGHPFNPVHMMPLVELGGGELTDPAAIDTATDFYVAMGKEPVRLHREIVGHIANRLTSAMFREAVSLVAEGYATVADVDRAIRFGPALKWAVQGQFTTFHTGGGDAGMEGFLRHFAPGIMNRWRTMTDPDLADPALQTKLTAQVIEANGHRPIADIARHQDAMVLRLLRALSE